MSTKMTPQLRFQEFTDEWQVKKLGEYYKLQGGYAFESGHYKRQGMPIIRISNISNVHNFIDIANLTYYEKIPKDEQFTVKTGDLLVAMSGATTGKASVYNLNVDGYLNQRVGLFREISKSSYDFLIQFVFSPLFDNQLDRVLVAGAQPNISSKDIENFRWVIPSKPEQEKIADFLTAVDERIRLQEQKLAKLEQYKRGVMQQIFSQKIRFKDENGNEYPEWEEKKLSEIASFVNGYTFLSSTYDKSGKYSIITIANVQEGRMDTTKASRVKDIPFNIQKDQILQLNDILISMTGNVGRVCRVDAENCLLNQRVGKIVTNAASADFVFAVLNSKKFLVEMESLAQGGAQGNLSSKDIMKYKFLLPTYNEQQKIATFLTALDDKITAEKSKLTAARQFKKAVLQRMFV